MSPAERDDTLTRADHYVLGLLTPQEEAEIEAALTRDPRLRGDVAAARERFLEIDLHAEPLAVDRGLWERIAAGLSARPPAAPVDRRRAFPRGAHLRGIWQGALAASLAAVLLFGTLVALLPVLRDPPAPVVVAVLLDPDTNDPGVIVEAFANDRVRVVPLSDIPIPEGRILQVWTLPDEVRGPVSLGLMREARLTSLLGPDLPRPQARQLYEITLEPAGGSPTGRPTGPILYKGFAETAR